MRTTLGITFTAELQRKHPKLPVYVVVPFTKAETLKLRETTVVEGTVNDQSIGRRTIKRWDSSEGSPWFVEFTGPFCSSVGIAVGDILNLALWVANAEIPVELEGALNLVPSVRAQWESLSAFARRTHVEHVYAGKSEATRSRRAAAVIALLAQASRHNAQ